MPEKQYTECTEVRAALPALMDGDLSPTEESAIEEHLNECDACAQEWEALEDESISFAAASRTTQRISYRPVIMAAVSLSLIAVMSYLLTQQLEGINGAGDTLTDTPEVPLESSDEENSDLDYWGEKKTTSDQFKRGPLPKNIDRDSADYKKRVKTLQEMNKQLFEDGNNNTSTENVTIRVKPNKNGTVFNIPEDSNQFPKGTTGDAKVLIARFTISDTGLWTEKGYTDQPLILLKPLTSAYTDMMYEKANLVNLTRHTRDIIFSYEEKWFRIAHIGPLIYDPILGDPHPKSRKLVSTEKSSD